MAPEGPSRWKSRFSLLSLLPARHPPLIISHQVPPVPTQYLPRQPTIISTISPVQSEYPSPTDTISYYTREGVKSPPILPPLPMLPLPRKKVKNEKAEMIVSVSAAERKKGGRRPPPLDLERTKALYPSEKATNELSSGLAQGRTDDATLSDEVEELKGESEFEAGKKHAKENREKQRQQKVTKEKIVDDPFEVAVVDAGHKYTSWKGGKVDINPGQVIPRGTLAPLRPPFAQVRGEQGESYESVLHNVLLTPTYLGPSPIPPVTPSPTASSSRAGANSRRKTLRDRAEEAISLAALGARGSRCMRKAILKNRDDGAVGSMQWMKEGEEADMGRHRRGTMAISLASAYGDIYSHSLGDAGYPNVYRSPNGDRATHSRSPGWLGIREAAVGSGVRGWTRVEGRRGKEENGRRGMKQAEDKVKRRKRIWKYSIILVILCLAALTIGLCISLLARSSSNNTTSLSSSSSSASFSSSPSSSPSASASSSTTSSTLTTCLSQWSSASTSPSSYPCTDCVPVLTSTTNDYTTLLVDGNSTGVGAALQFCAMMDVYRAGNNGSALEEGGWGRDASPCKWSGVSCDSRGRITALSLSYPGIPSTLSSTLANAVSLQSLHITGNGSIPNGPLPSALLGLVNLTTLNLEDTGLTGPISSLNWSAAAALETIYLSDNEELGTMLPSFSGNNKLVTLAITGEGLTSWSPDALPSSLTYLDLSFNSLSGQIPSLSQLSSLQTLYLENNDFSSAPSSLPSTLTTLSLTSNTNLSGTMPADVCSSSVLSSCDLRSTKLSASLSGMSSSSSSPFSSGVTSSTSSGIRSSAVSSATGSGTTSSAVAAASSAVCAVCKFS